jgi:hypothetical protein
MEAQERKERDSNMLVKGAWPLSKVLMTRATVWIERPKKATLKPTAARLCLLEKRKEK